MTGFVVVAADDADVLCCARFLLLLSVLKLLH